MHHPTYHGFCETSRGALVGTRNKNDQCLTNGIDVRLTPHLHGIYNLQPYCTSSKLFLTSSYIFFKFGSVDARRFFVRFIVATPDTSELVDIRPVPRNMLLTSYSVKSNSIRHAQKCVPHILLCNINYKWMLPEIC